MWLQDKQTFTSKELTGLY